MEAIVALASLAAIVWMVRKSYIWAFLDVYLPIVLCIPAWPRWVLPGLPDPTFQEAAILPIITVFLIRGRRFYRFSIFDLLVAAFIFMQGLSEYLNAGYAEAQNLMFDVLFNGLVPYLLAKCLLQTFDLRVRFLKRFVWCACIVIGISLYEAKFSYNLYKLVFDRLFASEGDVWVTTFRYGLARIAGPYGHAILAGIIFMIAIRMQSWLRRANLWEPQFRLLHFGRLSKGRLLALWTVLGLLLTWVRGPEFGAILAWIVSFSARGKNPKKRMKTTAIALVLTFIPLGIWGYSYASIGRAAATTAGQESAAYRKELLEGYIIIVKQHLWIGWGRNGWPHAPNMPSIDDYYLLMALMHGVISLGLLVAILAVISTRLYLNGLKMLNLDRRSSSLSFELLGIYIGFVFSIATVYVGESVLPVFFMLLGFSEALLVSCQRPETAKRQMTPQKTRIELAPFQFKRVVT